MCADGGSGGHGGNDESIDGHDTDARQDEAGAANPLEVSPGNHEANKPFTEHVSERSSSESQSGRRGVSGGGSGGAKGSGSEKK